MMQTSSQDSERQAYHDSFAAKLRRFMVDNAASFNALTTKEQIDPSLDDGRMDNNGQLDQLASYDPPNTGNMDIVAVLALILLAWQ